MLIFKNRYLAGANVEMKFCANAMSASNRTYYFDQVYVFLMLSAVDFSLKNE